MDQSQFNGDKYQSPTEPKKRHMSVLTSDDDFKTPTVVGSGKFRKFDASGDESSIPSLLDPQMLHDEREKVKICCFYLKRKVRDELVVAGLMLAVILFGAGNSVSSRVKGQAMGHFNFFASLGNAVMYDRTSLSFSNSIKRPNPHSFPFPAFHTSPGLG